MQTNSPRSGSDSQNGNEQLSSLCAEAVACNIKAYFELLATAVPRQVIEQVLQYLTAAELEWFESQIASTQCEQKKKTLSTPTSSSINAQIDTDPFWHTLFMERWKMRLEQEVGKKAPQQIVPEKNWKQIYWQYHVYECIRFASEQLQIRHQEQQYQHQQQRQQQQQLFWQFNNDNDFSSEWWYNNADNKSELRVDIRSLEICRDILERPHRRRWREEQQQQQQQQQQQHLWTTTTTTTTEEEEEEECQKTHNLLDILQRYGDSVYTLKLNNNILRSNLCEQIAAYLPNLSSVIFFNLKSISPKVSRSITTLLRANHKIQQLQFYYCRIPEPDLNSLLSSIADAKSASQQCCDHHRRHHHHHHDHHDNDEYLDDEAPRGGEKEEAVNLYEISDSSLLYDNASGASGSRSSADARGIEEEEEEEEVGGQAEDHAESGLDIDIYGDFLISGVETSDHDDAGSGSSSSGIYDSFVVEDNDVSSHNDVSSGEQPPAKKKRIATTTTDAENDAAAAAATNTASTPCGLTDLEFHSFALRSKSSAAEHLPKLLASSTSLTKLHMSFNNLTDELCAELVRKGINQCLSLQSLLITENEIGDESLVELAKATSSNLSLLNLTDNDIGSRGAMALAKAMMTGDGVLSHNLCNVNLSHNTIGDEGAIALGLMLKANTRLTTLTLSDCGISQFGAEALFECLCDNRCLETLIISGNIIGPNATLLLARTLAKNRTLRTLNIARCGITQGGFVGVPEFEIALTENTALEALDVSGNRIEDAGGFLFASVLKQKIVQLSNNSSNDINSTTTMTTTMTTNNAQEKQKKTSRISLQRLNLARNRMSIVAYDALLQALTIERATATAISSSNNIDANTDLDFIVGAPPPVTKKEEQEDTHNGSNNTCRRFARMELLDLSENLFNQQQHMYGGASSSASSNIATASNCHVDGYDGSCAIAGFY